MTLPYDTRRCTGHEVKEPFGWTLHKDCIGCQRRTTPATAVLINELRRALEAEPKTCEWKVHDDVHMPGTYETECGQLWSFVDGGLNENKTRYCHHCGGLIEVRS